VHIANNRNVFKGKDILILEVQKRVWTFLNN